MRHLFLMRHAKSSWKVPGLIDFDRPLNKRGKTAAPAMGRLLQSQNQVPNRIISSSACRARETAALLAESCAYPQAIELRDELYLPTPHNFCEVIADVDDEIERLLIISHNPGSEDFLYKLTGELITMATADIAHLAFDMESWEDIESQTRIPLLNFWKPRDFEL